MRAWRLVPLALLLLLAAGCGMYGALYLEEEEPPPSEVTEQAPVAEDEERDEDDTAGRP
jgi:predicted small lipoprotein YifL